ncbi:MAG: GvpL/GvpF family gas vesicle protein, partial [Deltaproteobacteria bacterium]|nr:GvpL/GvpF family gas vesicle protein [Deltaproteobacteria bacterium]
DAVNKRINELGQESFELFKGLSCEARINKLLPKEVTEKEDDMVLNSAFLVDKDKVSEFIHAVDDLKTRYNDKGFDFDCTGPWPPYNFCNLSKEKEQSG